MSISLSLLNQPDIELYYDYSQIEDEADRAAIQDAARIIKPRLRRAAQDIFESGRELLAVKDRLPHGQWQPWLETEFGLSVRMAQNWMNVARRLGDKNENFSFLSVSVLYLLASPSTKNVVIDQVRERIDQGHVPTVAEVRALKRRQRQGDQGTAPSDRQVALALQEELSAMTSQLARLIARGDYVRLAGNTLPLQQALQSLQDASVLLAQIEDIDNT